MPVTLKVKWSKNLYKDVKVDVDVDGALEQFQAQIFSLTNVPLENQKLLLKGKQIKSDEDMKKMLKDGVKIILMGSASELAAPPAEIKFVEDMTEAEKLSETATLKHTSAGLKNLGNTCYMNSTLQSFRNVKELKSALLAKAQEPVPRDGSSDVQLTWSLGSLYKDMDQTTEPVVPLLFTQMLRTSYPQFAEQDQMGRYKQQDADECLGQLLTSLESGLGNNAVQEAFGGLLAVEQKSPEAPDEPAKNSVEPFTKLQCFITGETNYLFQGLLQGMDDEVEKRSETLGRNAVYKNTRRISQLPKNLIVQFVRFGWNQREGKEGQKTKKLRKVTFPEKLDISQFCEQKLRNNLKAAQMKLKQEENKKLGLGKYAPVEKKKKVKKNDKTAAAPANSSVSETPSEPMTPEIRAANEAGGPVNRDGFPLGLDDDIDLPNDLVTSGTYELHAVVTHQGRTADSGHYIGWANQGGGDWLKFDDDVVTQKKTEDILSLAGGGDWHMSYINIYRRVDDIEEKMWDV